jgi:hypothetical protein
MAVASGGMLLVTMMVSGSAKAQDALGGGRVLDRNLGRDGRINDRVQQENFADRNLVITGEVAGGREFRGRVGYRSVGDFSSTTNPFNSNALFDFERRSALSSMDYVNLSQTSSQLRMGESLGSIEYRRSGYIPPVGTTGYDPREYRVPQSFQNRIIPDRRLELQLDRDVLAQTTAGAQSASSTQPPLIGVLPTSDGKTLLANASPLLGVRFTPAEDDATGRGLSLLDQARLMRERQAGGRPEILPRPGDPFRRSFESLTQPENLVAPERGADRVGTETEQERYEGVLRRLAERYAEEKNVRLDIDATLMRSMDEEFQKLREELSRTGSKDDEEAVEDADSDAAGGDEDRLARPDRRARPDEDPRRRDDDRDSRLPSGQIPSEIKPDQPDDPSLPADEKMPVPDDVEPQESQAKPLSRDELARLLKHNQTFDKLAGSTEDRFNELVSSAEQSLRAGEYFLAERRFTRAIRIVPDHPLASAGMVNAQIGAGVYLSAAITLRHLLTQHPEMIDSRYDKQLLPRDDRIETAVANLRQRIDRGEDRSESGLLIAYLGHQTDRKHLVEEGLGAMLSANARDPLARLLQDVWLRDDPEKPADPAQAAENQQDDAPADPDK